MEDIFHLAQHLKIAVIGPATKEFIETNVNFPVDFCPSEFNSDSFASEFKLKCTDDSNYLKPLKILLPRTSIADNKLIQDLEESKKIEVTQVDAYKTVKPDLSTDLIHKFKDLLLESQTKNERIKLSFTSSQCVRNFFENLSETIKIKDFLNIIDFYSIGPKVTTTLGDEIYKIVQEKDFDLKIFQSDEATLESLVDLLTEKSDPYKSKRGPLRDLINEFDRGKPHLSTIHLQNCFISQLKFDRYFSKFSFTHLFKL